MGYRGKVLLTFFFVIGDIIATSVRITFRKKTDLDDYFWLGGHAAIALLEGVLMFAFFTTTAWFTAGLLGELLYTIRFTLPMWVAHLFFLQMPWTYSRFISKASKPWDSGLYVFFQVGDFVVGLLFWVSLMYTVACMTDRRMYAPYHKEAYVETAAAKGLFIHRTCPREAREMEERMEPAEPSADDAPVHRATVRFAHT